MHNEESVEDMDKDQLQEEVRHVSKIIWTQMQALLTYLTLHRQEGTEGEDEDEGKDQEEVGHLD